MNKALWLGAVLLVTAPGLFAQNEDAPFTFLETGWSRATRNEKTAEVRNNGPVRMMIPENRNFQRNAREQQNKGIDPNENTVDGRSATLERINQEAQAPRKDDKTGYSYFAKVRNDSDRTIQIIYWEYRFTELATPTNVVRRQFLCGATIKPGDQSTLTAFSSLAPSEVISAESLAKTNTPIFDEKVFVNRIEYSDGAILQRHDWKFDEIKKSVKQVTSTPWGKETCRAL